MCVLYIYIYIYREREREILGSKNVYLNLTFVNCQILNCTYSNLVKNFADLGFKSHVQHTISLIQHKICATAQVGFSYLQEIDQTARCGNADFNTFRKSSNVYLKKSP